MIRPAPGVEIYREHPRSYRSTVVFGVAILAGAVLDFSVGGFGLHLWAWLAALILICGLDAAAVAASQRLRSIAVTRERLIVGEHTFDRSEFEGVEIPAERGVSAIAPAPRGSVLLGVRVRGGGVLGVPTRRPEELAAVLGFRAAPVLLDVRPAEASDLPDLPELERRADTVFAVAGIGPLPPAAAVAEFAAAPALFVAGRPAVGFARLDTADDGAHLESLSVLPSHMRRGIGGALVEQACTWAREAGYPHITLCTFENVPWNAPFYARHGFEVLPLDQWTPRLVQLREEERAIGLDALGPRVVMRRLLAP